MAYRSSVHESTGFSPYWLMFGEECTLPMDVGLPRQEPDLPDPITSPYAVWVHYALELAYDQVRRHSGQAVQRQKRLNDRRAVRRMFAVGDWVFALLLPCKEVQTGFRLGWSISCCVPGRLGARDSATSGFTHYPCTLPGLEEDSTAQWFSVMDGCCSSGGRTHDSSVRRQYDGSHFTGLPLCGCPTPDEGAVLPDVDSVKSARSFSGSQSDRPDAAGMYVWSAALSLAVEICSQTILLVDVTSNLHPFFTHRLDAGPMRLATIAHAFNYRVAVLRDGVKLAARVGRSRKTEGRILEDTDISWGQQVVAVMLQIVSALALEVPAFLQSIELLRGVSPDVHLACEPWGREL